MNNFKHVFTPIKIGRMTVKNRIEHAPAMPILAGWEGDVTRELIEWERAMAKGGAGIVTIGDTPIVTEIASRLGHVLNLGTDKSINALNRLAETIQRYGTKASVELTYHDHFISHSPNDFTADGIKSFINAHIQAARRCKIAGLDMIMIHAGHGHTISQFLSPKANSRKDAYGGSFDNRSRIIVQILDGIREVFGDKLAIEYRMSGDELCAGGLGIDDQLELAKLIESRIDLLHISAGKLYEEKTIPRIFQPVYLPRGANVYLAEKFKKELKIPVTAVGGLDMRLAEIILSEGKADIVAMARTLIADPDAVNKAKAGREQEIRPCVRCNTCIDLSHKALLPVHCAVNPIAGREAEFMNIPPPGRKKVVVIGGGPAGMEAGRRAADLGHEVILFEKDAELGGALTSASAPDFKTDMKAYLDWAVRKTMNAPNLTVRLSAEATPELIMAEKPDAVIIAVGAEPVFPQIHGIKNKNVMLAGDADLGKCEIGHNVLVAGAGLTGSETALHLARQGRKVTVVDMLPLSEIDADSPFVNIIALRSMMDELNINIKTEVKLIEINEGNAVVIDKNNKKDKIPYDTIVLALGVKQRADLVKKFEDIAPDTYLAGDCNKERGNLYNAVMQGFFAAMNV